QRLAAEAHTDCNVLLGNAIAHELGHLLMATNSHGPVGLMRAFWSQDEIRTNRTPDWTFAPGDANAIRHGAAATHALAGGGAPPVPRDSVLSVRAPAPTGQDSEFSVR